VGAYVIVEIDIVDPIGYEEYKKQAAATVHKYGGKYLVRGGKTEVLEGDWKPKRIVVLEFESMQRAKEWLNCEEYRQPRKMRHRTAETKMILVEGVSGGTPSASRRSVLSRRSFSEGWTAKVGDFP
jgi:uncharacterized protein (DUF1330 family)